MQHYGIDNVGLIATDELEAVIRLNIPVSDVDPEGDFSQGDLYYNSVDERVYKYTNGWNKVDGVIRGFSDTTSVLLYPVMVSGTSSDETAKVNMTSDYFSYNSKTGTLTTIEQKSRKNTVTGNVADDSTIELLILIGNSVVGAGKLVVAATRDDGTVANRYTSIQSTDQGGTARYLVLNPSGGAITIGTTSILVSELLRVNGQIAATDIKLTTGAAIGKVWKCADVLGNGSWETESATLLSMTPDPTISTDLTIRGPQASMVAGENLTFGSPCYLKSDGKWWKTNATSTTTMACGAIAGATISADATGLFALPGSFLRNDDWTWATLGGILYPNNTSGVITQTMPSDSGNQLQNIGYAYRSNIIFFGGCPILVEIK